jgi:hypothetical protein
MTKNKNFKKKGFALLYAILLSGSVLTVGIILMNIITKQLVYSSVNRNSELAYYYAANSGRECLDYFAGQNYNRTFYSKNKLGDFTFKNPVRLKCLGQNQITFNGPNRDASNPNLQIYTSSDLTMGNSSVKLTVTFNEQCLKNPVSCAQKTSLTERYGTVMVADGFSSAPNSKMAKRTAISVKE